MPKPFTVQNHMLVESISLSIKSQERAIRALGSKEELLKVIKNELIVKLKDKAIEQFGEDRDFIIESGKTVIEHKTDSSIFISYFTLVASVMLAEASDAEIGEVIHPNKFKDSVELDQPIIELSPLGYHLQAHFDIKLMQLLKITDKSILLKYFTRIK